jgi:hypothetical protein
MLSVTVLRYFIDKHYYGLTINCVFFLVTFDSPHSLQYILREMPSSPVPASCCTSLVRAYRKTDLKLALFTQQSVQS